MKSWKVKLHYKGPRFSRNLECVYDEETQKFICNSQSIKNIDDETFMKTQQRDVTLKLSNVSLADAGLYACMATNRWGKAIAEVRLKVSRSP